jgi:succinate-acetate transporter protein
MNEKKVEIDGKSYTVRKKSSSEEEDFSIAESFGFERKKLLFWLFPFLTYVIGDTVTTYYATSIPGVNEMNPVVFLLGLHQEPILFAKVKIILLATLFIFHAVLHYFLTMARLRKDISYYIVPGVIGIVGTLVVINNIIAIINNTPY